ncbi:MAG: nucleotidyltransferase family protein [Muribaculaceae bacterium]|nr:nucleotidyltransferase family protein [Muribaculaceae bacterium]
MESRDTYNNISVFFVLLRSGMYDLPIPENQLPDHIDWAYILELARKHTVMGLIIDSIRHLPPNLRPSAPISEKLDKFALRLISSNAMLDRAAIRLGSFLNSHGIKGVLLKGQGVARSYYHMPQLRQCGDIDFYVGKKQFRKAVELCRQELIHDKENGGMNEKHFNFDLDGVNIEIHRTASQIYTPIRAQRFQKWIEEELDSRTNTRTVAFGNTEITLPSYDFDAIFIFQHAWQHFITGGIGLRQLCEWALILQTHYDDIDVAKLEENIRSFGLTRGWKLFACIAVKHLGVSPCKMPLYDPSYSGKSEKYFKTILRDGNFGYYSEAYARTPIVGYGLWHGLGKIRNFAGYYISLFSFIPVDSTCVFFHRMTSGSAEYIVRNIRKFRNDHSKTK